MKQIRKFTVTSATGKKFKCKKIVYANNSIYKLDVKNLSDVNLLASNYGTFSHITDLVDFLKTS